MIRKLLLLALAAGLGLLLYQQYPDIARYLKIKRM